MKTLYCIIASLILSVSLFGQAPPVLRQALTTNTAPVNPTNPGQIPIWTGTAWQFGTNLSGLVVTQLVSGDLLWTNISEVLNPTVFSRPVNASNFWVNSSPALAPNDSGVNLVVGHTDWRALHFQILNNHELQFTNINATRARLLPDTDLEIELGNTDMRFDGIYTAVIDSRTASDLDLFSDQSIFLNIGSAAYRFTSTSARPSPTLTLDLGIASAQWNGVYASNYTAGGGITNNGTYQHSVGAFTGALFVSSNANGVAYWSTNVNNIGVTNLSVYNNVIFNGSIVSNFNRDILWTNDGVVLRGTSTGRSPKDALRWGNLSSGSEMWNSTNVGFLSFAAGSNVLARGNFSVVFGEDNEVRTNANYSTISGGRINVIWTNAHSAFVGGGQSNRIVGIGAFNSVIVGGSNNLAQMIDSGQSGGMFIGGGGDHRAASNYCAIVGGLSSDAFADYSFIGGGLNHGIDPVARASAIVGGEQNGIRGHGAFIGGGFQNGLGLNSTVLGSFGVIVGGSQNIIAAVGTSTNAFIGGGARNDIRNDAHLSVIVGGRTNMIEAATNCVIVGGNNNRIESAHMGQILGGQDNHIASSGDFGAIIGHSNQVNANFAIVIGNKGTNTLAGSIAIAPRDAIQTTFTSSNMVVRTSFATAPDTVVTLAADNQVVDATLRTHIRLASDSAVAGDRTFLLTGTNVTSGAHAILEWTGTNAGELVDDSANSGAGNIRLSATWTPTQYDTLSLIFNGTDWVETARATN